MELKQGNFYQTDSYFLLLYSSIPRFYLLDPSDLRARLGPRAAAEAAAAEAAPSVAAARALVVAAVAACLRVRWAAVEAEAEAEAEDDGRRNGPCVVSWFDAGQPFMTVQDAGEDCWAMVAVGEKVGYIVNRPWLDLVPWKPSGE